MKKYSSLLLVLLLASCAGPKKPVAEQPGYEANWESLSRHQAAPEWFQDAKLGIYFHWGVYSVPAYGSEWYPRFMHVEDHEIYRHHVETYGHPSEFGYHDFVPLFKAAYFDAAEWADLFQKAGARFAGPVAEHHDGFAMWDSKATPWNAAHMGPEKDITGLLATELKLRDMKLITTFHHAKQLQRHDSIASEGHEPYQWSHYPWNITMPTSSEDPKLRMLYGNMPEGHFRNHQEFLKIKYSWEDVRYTTRDNLVFATLLGWPGAGEEILLTAFAPENLPDPLEVSSVELLGSSSPPDWELREEGLSMVLPQEAPDEMAVVFKIETR